jgi:hypothetical protein
MNIPVAANPNPCVVMTMTFKESLNKVFPEKIIKNSIAKQMILAHTQN